MAFILQCSVLGILLGLAMELTRFREGWIVAVLMLGLAIWFANLWREALKGKPSKKLWAGEIDPELFSLPVLLAEGVASPGKAESWLRRWEKLGNWTVTLVIFAFSGLVVAGGVSVFRMDAAAVMICGGSGVAISLLGIMVRCGVLFLEEDLLSQLEEERKVLREERPGFRFGDRQQRDDFCRRWPGIPAARAACTIVKKFGFDFMVYPEDSFCLICGRDYLLIRGELEEQFGAVVNGVTFRDVVEQIVNAAEMEGISEEEFPRDQVFSVPPPPPSDTMAEICSDIEQEKWGKLEMAIREELKARPEISPRLFASYWPTREEAEIALKIRNMAVRNFERPDTMMCYPGDPMPFLIYYADDSMESVEFLLEMEQTFGISISDAEAQRVFSLTLAELVGYVREKQ